MTFSHHKAEQAANMAALDATLANMPPLLPAVRKLRVKFNPGPAGYNWDAIDGSYARLTVGRDPGEAVKRFWKKYGDDVARAAVEGVAA